MKKYSTVLEFGYAFDSEEKCFAHLCKLKWEDGFTCRRCGNNEFIKGRTWYYRRCRSCKYDESCTAHTLFHKLKFPVTRAFMIIHQISTLKKGLSTCEISRQFLVHQETAWFFKRKIQQAMDDGLLPSLVAKPEDQKAEADEDQKDNAKKSAESKSKTVVIEIRRPSSEGKVKTEGNEIEIKHDLGHQLKGAVEDSKSIEDQAKYKNLMEKFDLIFQLPSGAEVNNLSWYIYNLKNWIKGIHHQTSIYHLQRYLNEYQYRFDRRMEAKCNPTDVLQKMVFLPWLPYKKAKAS